MRIAEFFLLIFLSLSFASSSLIHERLSSVLMQENKVEEHHITYGIKREGGSGHGSSNGHGNGQNGGSRSPNTQGGSAVIPAYVAGAARAANANERRHQGHRGSNSSNPHRIQLSTFLVITLVYPLIQLCFLT